MSAGSRGAEAAELAVRKLDLAAEIRGLTDMMKSIAKQKDALTDKFQALEAKLEEVKSRPSPPPPHMTEQTRAEDHSDYLDELADFDMKKAAEEDKIAGEMEATGDAKDQLDQEYEQCVQQHAVLKAELASLNGAGQAVAA